MQFLSWNLTAAPCARPSELIRTRTAGLTGQAAWKRAPGEPASPCHLYEFLSNLYEFLTFLLLDAPGRPAVYLSFVPHDRNRGMADTAVTPAPPYGEPASATYLWVRNFRNGQTSNRNGPKSAPHIWLSSMVG